MAQNEQTTEEHSTLEQQSPGRLDHPAWCFVWTVGPASVSVVGLDESCCIVRTCVCVTVQVKARNASAEVIYRTRHVNMSRAAADTCDILPSALPAGNCLPRVRYSYSCVGGVVSAHMRWAFEHVRDRKSSSLQCVGGAMPRARAVTFAAAEHRRCCHGISLGDKDTRVNNLLESLGDSEPAGSRVATC